MPEIKDNVIQLEGVLKKLNITLQENIDKLNAGATATASYGKSFSNVPSQYVNNLKSIKSLLDEVKKSQEKLTKEEKESIGVLLKLNQLQRSNNATEKSNITTKNALNKETERQAKTARDASSAYIQLSKAEALSARAVQDLIARGKLATQTQKEYNAELRKAQKDFDSLHSRVLNADKAVGKFNRNVGNYPKQAISGLKNLLSAFGIVGGLTLFANAIKEAYTLSKELQGLNQALKQVTGTQEEYSNQQSFLKGLASDFGVEINSLTQQFTQFYVSAKNKIAGEDIQQIFKSVTKAGATMGLSVEAQQRAFLALNQMMSKGVVSAEELRGQLGEALPGAFGIMAKALNTNEVGLNKMLKSGSLLAKDVLPKFAKALEQVYGIETVERIENVISAENRLKNSWVSFVGSVTEGNGIISNALTGLYSILTKVIDGFALINQSEKDRLKSTGAGVEESGFLKTKNALNKNYNDILKERLQVVNKLNLYEAQLKSDPNNASIKSQINQTKEHISVLDDFLNKEKEQIKQSAISMANDVQKRISLKKEEIFVLLARNKEIKYSIENDKMSVRSQQLLNFEREKNAKLMEQLTYELKFAQGELRAFNSVNEKQNKIIKENNNLLDSNTKAKEKNIEKEKEKIKSVQDLIKLDEVQKESQIGSLDWLNKNISAQEEIMNATAKGSDEYIRASESLRFYSEMLENVYGNTKKTKEELSNWSDEFRKTFQDDFISNSGFDKIFFMIENFKELKTSGVDTALAISEAFQQAFNTISEASQQNFEYERARVEEQYDFNVKMAGDSESAKEELARQKEIKLKEIQAREAKAQKKLALFNIATNTAQAILATYAKVGFPAGIPLAVAMGAIGAVQAGLVLSQEIPQFWKGTENAPEGLAWTQERGAEVITDKKGNIKTLGTDKGAQLTYLSKGDKVYKSHEEYINKELASNGINKMGSYLDFQPNFQIKGQDFTQVTNQISNLANVIKNKESVNMTIYKDKITVTKGHKEIMNNRLKLKANGF